MLSTLEFDLLGDPWPQGSLATNLEPYIQSRSGNVLIDVGGIVHHVRIENFVGSVLPSSRLGRLFRATTKKEVFDLCDHFSEGDPPTVFYDRNSSGFNTVLDIYRTGKLHFTEKSCALVMKQDFDFWGIDEMLLEPCCALKYYPEMEVCSKEQEGELQARRLEQQRALDEDFGDHCLGRIRSKLWNLTEYPESGIDAQVSAFFSLFVVVVSTGTFVLGTLEEFQEPEDGNYDDGVERFETVIVILGVIDTICVTYFTLEYVIRFLCSPRKLHFLVQPMNLVDLFAIIPYFLTIFLHQLEDIQIIGKAGKIVRLVRIMRILRVFKLVRHFAGLQSLIHTMHQAYKELGLLLFLISVTVLTVSCLVYFAERDEGVWSFVDSFWFALMTLTTVGYDLNPRTMLGKVTGGFCALLGVFILTLPIPIVVNSFASYYKNRLWRNEVAVKKRDRIRKATICKEPTENLFIPGTVPSSALDLGIEMKALNPMV